ncbi:aldo/keto reductase [Vagococcus salmoninarum]|uniref:aldo/keto reductase n=1 Tax=Vagococcus salmoninarum TaxID=2739 RepID=UPI003F9CC6F2
MEYLKLGTSDLLVSRIGLGCMGFGKQTAHHSWTIDQLAAQEIIKSALDLGINFFDTALVYADGTSEKYLGQAIKNLTKREDVIIASKFPVRSPEEIANQVSGQEHVANMLEQSLTNLGMDYLDLYICHMWDYQTPMVEVMEGMHQAVVAGKVRAIGISNCYAWQLAELNCLAEMNGWTKFVSIQGHYNMLFREEEREMVPYCQQANIALTPYSPLASGRLVKDASETSPRLVADQIAKMKYDQTLAQDKLIIQRVAEIAEKRNLSRTQVALGWLLQKSTAPIVGATKVSHIEAAVAAVGITFSPTEMSYLEEAYQPHELVGVMAFNGK